MKPATMTIETRPFGPIDVPEESLIDFPRGLYGLEDSRRYCLLPHGDSEGFYWLLAADRPSIAMVVTDPFPFFQEYEVVVPDEDAAVLAATTPADVAIYTSVTVNGGDEITTNLLGPIAINHKARRGVQLVQDGNRYTTRHPIGRSRG